MVLENHPLQGSTNHRGQDFPAVIGTSIPAAADGIVYGTYAKKKMVVMCLMDMETRSS